MCSSGNSAAWRPEYADYMLEGLNHLRFHREMRVGTPGLPYNGSLECLLTVEANMKYRYIDYL